MGGAICGHACCGVDGALDSPGQRRHAPCRSDILKKPGALGVTLVGGSLAAADAASGIWGELTPRLQLSLDALDAMLVRCHCMACRPATPKTLAKQPNAIVMYTQTRQSCTMRGGGSGQAPAVLCIWRRQTLAPCSSCPVDPTLASEVFARPPPTLPHLPPQPPRPSGFPRLSSRFLPPDRLHALLLCRERAEAGSCRSEDRAGHGGRRHPCHLCSVRHLGPDSAVVRRTSRCIPALGKRRNPPLLQDKIAPLLSAVVSWLRQPRRNRTLEQQESFFEVTQRDVRWD